jgi:FixJ family two-component response regulator
MRSLNAATAVLRRGAGRGCSVSDTTLIAIVEDDGSMRPAVMSLVRSLGYEAEGFESAEDFLKSDAACEAACIITDIQMPGMSGIELKRQLAARGHAAPVIMITARAEPELESQAMASGAVCFLRKPFQAEALISCLSSALVP